jgi:hypothetical protein
MNTSHVEEKNLTTADVAAAADRPPAQREATRAMPERGPERRQQPMGDGQEQLAALFTPEMAGEFRSRWDAVQIGFVDDPKQAVRHADELVAQVMKSLAETFSGERARFEGEMEHADSASTETMRVALRRYRSFFERLLSL